MYKIALIGHREIFSSTLSKRLYDVILSEIQQGCRNFTMGTHGAFDRLRLKICRELRMVSSGIEIEVVITRLNSISKHAINSVYDTPYSDVKTVIYEIEDVHYKQQIIVSNRKMINSCNTLICYVDETKKNSGAKLAMNYAKKKGLKIINLYLEKDNFF